MEKCDIVSNIGAYLGDLKICAEKIDQLLFLITKDWQQYCIPEESEMKFSPGILVHAHNEKRVCVEIVQDIFDEMGYTVETMRKELGKINE